MTPLEQAEKFLEDLKAANSECKETIREAHETLKSMKLFLKDMDQHRAAYEDMAKNAVDHELSQHVERGLKELNEAVAKSIEETSTAIHKRFDELTNTLLYGNKKGLGPSILVDLVKNRLPPEGFVIDGE